MILDYRVGGENTYPQVNCLITFYEMEQVLSGVMSWV